MKYFSNPVYLVRNAAKVCLNYVALSTSMQITWYSTNGIDKKEWQFYDNKFSRKPPVEPFTSTDT